MNSTTITATNARRDFFKLLRDVNNKHEVLHIQHPSDPVVVLAEDDYESLIETLELLSTPNFAASMQRSIKQVKQGEVIDMDDIFKS